MYLTIRWRNSLMLLSVQHLQRSNNLGWSDIYWPIAKLNFGGLTYAWHWIDSADSAM